MGTKRMRNDLTRPLAHGNSREKIWCKVKKEPLEIVIGIISLHIECSRENIHRRIFGYTKCFPEKKMRRRKKLNKGKNVHMATAAVPGNAHTHIHSRLISRNVVNNDGFYQCAVRVCVRVRVYGDCVINMNRLQNVGSIANFICLFASSTLLSHSLPSLHCLF